MTSEERERLLALAGARGVVLLTAPTLAVVDEGTRGAIALAWELRHRECPFVEARDGKWWCGIYDARPLACRAFPLRARHGGLGVSPACPEAFIPEDGDFAAAYPGCAGAAREAGGALARFVARAEAMEERGEIRLARGLTRGEVEAAVEATLGGAAAP